MKLVLLLIATAACLHAIEARVVRKSYENADDIVDRQLTDYLESKDKTAASIAAAEEYFRAPEPYNLRKAQERVAAAQERVAATQRRLTAMQERLAAGEYSSGPNIRRVVAKSTIGDGNAAFAVHISASEVPRRSTVLRAVAEGFGAAAQYYRESETPKQLSKAQVQANYAAAAEYFRPPRGFKPFRRSERVIIRQRS